MPKTYVTFIDGKNIYVCKKCQTHLVPLNELVSKAFRGRTGFRYVLANSQNVKQGDERDQSMLSGLHRVSSIYCGVCDNDRAIGWKYIKAYEAEQKYKQGRYIIERYFIKKQNWDDGEDNQSE